LIKADSFDAIYVEEEGRYTRFIDLKSTLRSL
jgi:hypothetical protein